MPAVSHDRTDAATEPDRDDRILPETRWAGRIIAPILVVATIMLYGFPHRTGDLFAWPINPEMTALVMGAGYGTGVYYFYRVATGDEWHRVGAILPGISLFVWFMGVATALHWQNFTQSHPSFWMWTILYAVGPIVLPLIWIRNNRTDPRPALADAPMLPNVVRLAAIGSGAVIVLLAVVLFAVPAPLIEYWPWAVSPLTSRVLLGWFALLGAVNLAAGLDQRWSAARLPVQTQLIGFGLMIIAVARAWSDFDTTNPATWAYLGGFVVYLAALAALYYRMEART